MQISYSILMHYDSLVNIGPKQVPQMLRRKNHDDAILHKQTPGFSRPTSNSRLFKYFKSQETNNSRLIKTNRHLSGQSRNKISERAV